MISNFPLNLWGNSRVYFSDGETVMVWNSKAAQDYIFFILQSPRAPGNLFQGTWLPRGLQTQIIEVEVCRPENPSFFNQACLGQCTCLFSHVHRILWFPTQLEVSNSVWTRLTPGSVIAPVTSAYVAVLMTPDDSTDWLPLHSVQTSPVTTVD